MATLPGETERLVALLRANGATEDGPIGGSDLSSDPESVGRTGSLTDDALLRSSGLLDRTVAGPYDPYSREIVGQRRTLNLLAVNELDYDYEGRQNFGHFACHPDGVPAACAENPSARNSSVRGLRRWIDEAIVDSVVKCTRAVMDNDVCGVISLMCVFAVVFFADLSELLQLPTSKELDVCLTACCVYFCLEQCALCLVDETYPLSSMFFADTLSTASIAYDVSFLFGPDVEKVRRLATSGGSATSWALTAGIARLVVRCARLSRAMKLVRRMRQANKATLSRMGLRTTIRMSSAVSVRITFFIVGIVSVLRISDSTLTDGSMIAWSGWLAADAKELQGARELRPAEATQARGLKAHGARHRHGSRHRDARGDDPPAQAHDAQLRLSRRAKQFVEFFAGGRYFPFQACLGELKEAGGRFGCEGLAVDLPGSTSQEAPRRRSSILLVEVDGMQVFFDTRSVHCAEALVSIASSLVVSVSAVVGMSLVTRFLTESLVLPWETVLEVLRTRARSCFKGTNMLEHLDEMQEAASADYMCDADPDASVERDFERLGAAISKLAAIGHLVATDENHHRHKPQNDLTENDIVVRRWTQCGSEGELPRKTTPKRAPRGARGSMAVSKFVSMGTRMTKVPKEIIEGLSHWDFDTLTVAPEFLDTVAAYVLMGSAEPIAEYVRSITTEAKVLNFASALQEYYLPNAYHNFFHAVDVLCTMNRSFEKVEVDRILLPNQQFGLLLAALGHDLGHFGISNAYLVETSAPLAVTYNDTSPLENMHCSMLFRILGEEESNVLKAVPKSDFQEMRKCMISSILSTDISKHTDMVKELKTFQQMNIDGLNETHATDADEMPERDHLLMERKQLVANALLHAADIGNPMKPWELCHKNALLVCEEFFAQGDSEKTLGIPVGILNDREKVNIPNSQLGFVEFMVAPFVVPLVAVFPQLRVCSQLLADNLERWFELWVEEARPPDDVQNKVRARVEKVIQSLQAQRQNATEHSSRSAGRRLSIGLTFDLST